MKLVLAASERYVALVAGSFLGSSMLLFGGFLFFAYAVAVTHAFHAVVAAALLLLYLVQFHYLSVLHRKARPTRLLIWKCSLAAHLVVFIAAYLLTRDSIVFVLLVPEAFSAVLHVFGLYLASRSAQTPEPSFPTLSA